MRKLTGKIVSNKMTKTVVVRVDRLKKHSKYLKYFRTSTHFKAHVDDEKKYHPGDVVVIQETRPLSKGKRWRVAEVVKRKGVEESIEEAETESP